VSRSLYVLACGASPAADLASLAALAVADGWDVYPGATPMGRTLIDADRLTAVTGHAPRHEYSGRTSGWPPADGIVVAAATLNTIGKLAAGIADTWVLSTVTEHFGLGVPVVVAPCVNPALARHPRFPRNVADLRSWGISVLWDAERTEKPWMAPWDRMLDEVAGLVAARASRAPRDPRDPQ
jgi:phosphopantothenoylcysteine synthetase/decarboxylase